MLTKYKMEAIHMDELKRRLFNELEMHETRVCSCDGELKDHDVECVYKLSKTLYYLDCITKGEKGKQHHHIHYKGGDIPDYLDGETHHHVEYKEEVSADMHSTSVRGMI